MRGADANRLRQLVNDRYQRLISQESYRQQRSALLNNLGRQDTDAAEVTTTLAPSRPPADSSPQPGTASRPAPTRERPGKGIFAAGAVLAVIGLAVIYFVVSTPGTDVPDGQTSDVPVPAVDQGPAAGSVAILDDFLRQNDWSGDSLARLEEAWDALDNEQRAAAAEDLIYRRFTGGLHQRIREEAALSEAVSPRMRSLLDLADKMGAPFRLSASLVSEESATTATTGAPSAPPPSMVPANDVVREPPAGETPADETLPPVIVDRSADSAPAQDASDAPATEQPTASTVQVEEAPPDVGTAGPVAEAPPDVGTATPGLPASDPCPPSLASSRRPYCQDALADGGVGPMMVVLQTGAFQMGSNDNDEESPLHNVNITRPIAMSRDEISLAEYRIYCTAAGVACPEARWGGDDYPVVMVSWRDASSFAAWLSEQTGQSYRLPSEAEWEYAARAGTQTPYSFGDEITPSAAHSSLNGDVSAPLPRSDRSVNRNGFRLYHMSGNVREWVADDWYPGYDGAPDDGSPRSIGENNQRVVRGGSFEDPATFLRSAARVGLNETHRDELTGIRLVRDIRRQQP